MPCSAWVAIEPKEIAKRVRTLATAMQADHQAQVIHRDLKPANVLPARGTGVLACRSPVQRPFSAAC